MSPTLRNTALDCYEVQERLTEIVDGRSLEAAPRRELDLHLDGCTDCRATLDLAHATKRTIARLKRPHSVPPNTVSRIKDLLSEEQRRDATLRPAASRFGVWSLIRKNPVWTAAALAIAMAAYLYLLPRTDRERRFNESSAAFVQQAITTYDALVRDTQTIQIKTSDEKALKAFFLANGVTCDVHVPQLQNASLFGGSVSVTNHAHVAHVIYECGKHYICLCQLKMCDACPTNQTALSDSAKACLSAGQWYWYCGNGNRNVGLWKYEDTLCAATSDCNPQEIAALFTESH